jgi:lipopolysaccharide cholinephosphotransferase
LKQKIVIFGAGNAGSAAFKNLLDEFQILAFCDNDPQKIGTRVENIPVVSPEELQSIAFDCVMIASEYAEQIRHQLANTYQIPTVKLHVLCAAKIKPFHFGDSAAGREKAEHILIALCEVLTACGIKYHLDAGTLLGIYRDNNLIPWDDDLDIAVPDNCVEIIRTSMPIILESLYAVSQIKWKCTELYALTDFGLLKKGTTRGFKLEPKETFNGIPLVDLFVKYIGDGNMDYVISSRGFSMPSEHMFNLELYTFKENQVFIPSNVEGYLSAHYGDWQTPNSNWTLNDIKSATIF